MIEASKKSPTYLLSLIVVFVCSFRFLLDGITFNCCGITFSFGHVDSLSYTAIMAPILGAHSWIQTKKTKVEEVK